MNGALPVLYGAYISQISQENDDTKSKVER